MPPNGQLQRPAARNRTNVSDLQGRPATLLASAPSICWPRCARAPACLNLVSRSEFGPIAALTGAKAAIVATEWPDVVNLPWENAASVMASPRFIFDGRNSLDMDRLNDLGFHYRGVGRTRTEWPASS